MKIRPSINDVIYLIPIAIIFLPIFDHRLSLIIYSSLWVLAWVRYSIKATNFFGSIDVTSVTLSAMPPFSFVLASFLLPTDMLRDYKILVVLIFSALCWIFFFWFLRADITLGHKIDQADKQ